MKCFISITLKNSLCLPSNSFNLKPKQNAENSVRLQGVDCWPVQLLPKICSFQCVDFSRNCLFANAKCSASAVTRRTSYLFSARSDRTWASAGEEMNGFTLWLRDRRLRQTHSCEKPEQEQMWASLPMVEFRGSLILLRKGSASTDLCYARMDWRSRTEEKT